MRDLRLTRGNSAGVLATTRPAAGALWTRGGSLRVIDSTSTTTTAPRPARTSQAVRSTRSASAPSTIVGSVVREQRRVERRRDRRALADLSITDSVIADNDATGTGGNPGHGGNGGGVYSDGNDQVQSLCGVTLSGNSANAFGGGYFRVSNNGVGPMQIDETSVLSNTTPNVAPAMAGGMYLQGVQIEMRDSTVAWNQARGSAGLFIGPSGTTLDMENVTIAENTALSSLAGGMAISGGVTGSIRNATIARNAAPGPVAFAGGTRARRRPARQLDRRRQHRRQRVEPISCSHLRRGFGTLQCRAARERPSTAGSSARW